MEYVLDSDIAVQTAWWIGTASISLVVLLMLEIVLLRFLLIWRKRRVARLHEKWQPFLVESLDRIPENLPARLARAEVFEFLLLWNYMRESLRDEAGENLIVIARSLGVHQKADKMLGQRNLRKKLLAIQTLGWLRESAAWGKLASIAEGDDPVLSLCAAHALLRIETQKALALVLPLVARRTDWSFAIVGGMLKEAGADIISQPLAHTVLQIPREQAPRMLRFLELAHQYTVVPAVRKLIASASDLETITACLRILQDAEDLPKVRSLLKDERWQIRLQAAVCLGRIGTPEDVARLAHACGDLEWWVRYRSAQSLANLPFVTPEKYVEIAETHQNEFARDIIRQVIAERQVIG